MTRIELVVHRDAGNHWEYDGLPGVSPSTDYERYPPPCGAKGKMEELLVGASAHWFVSQLKVPFNEFVYAPNKGVENRCGFDLSLGRVNDRGKRLRIQCKYVNRWADEYGKISVASGNGREKTTSKREKDQIRNLITLFKGRPDVNDPFLMIFICHCNCEYRRMGTTLEHTLVPDIDSLQRTICIELGNQHLADLNLAGNNWKIVLRTNAQASPQAIVKFEDVEIPLNCLSLRNMLDRFKVHNIDPMPEGENREAFVNLE